MSQRASSCHSEPSSGRRHYLVTGATSGIGRAIAERLLENGHEISALIQSRSRERDLPTGISQTWVTDFAKTQTLGASLARIDGRFDGIINAAAILPGKSFAEVSPAILNAVFAVNALAPILLIQALASGLKENSCIVLFGSISGHKGSYDDAYAASKGAVHSLVRSLSPKLAPRTRILAICPGMTDDTRMTAELVAGLRDRTLNSIPVGAPAKAADIAKLTAFLLSDAARSITGALIDVNGGQYLRT